MNCPICKKPLPKDNPRICPHCKRDLTNFYKLKEKQGELQPVREEKNPKLRLILTLALVACFVVGVFVLIFVLNREKDEPAEPLNMEQVAAEINSKQLSDFVPTDEPTDYVKLTVKDFGEIVVRLRPDVAPISAQNFKDLVERGYYNGTTFHRVYPGFMIQGGAGEGDVSPIKGEFKSNGVDNPLLHIRGVLSMARTTVMDSATSQFFLMQADNATLDGNYAAFGYIVAGLETVDKVCEIDLGDNPYNGEHSVPLTDVIIESAVFVAPKD